MSKRQWVMIGSREGGSRRGDPMITLAYCVLCDHATMREGQQDIFGAAVDVFEPMELPRALPQLAVAIGMKVSPEAAIEPINVYCDIVNAVGQSILGDRLPGVSAEEKARLKPEVLAAFTTIAGTIGIIPDAVPPPRTQLVPVNYAFRDIYFEDAGTYYVTVTINDIERARLDFTIVGPEDTETH